MTIVITSGGYDPIHKGHIEYLKKAKELGDFHVAIVNNDKSLSLKKGKSFMDENGRLSIVKELKCVDKAIISIDNDLTVCKTIELVYNILKTDKTNFIFAKGGDRYKDEIPEAEICKKYCIQIVDGLGEKIESSSNLIKNLK